MWPREALGDQAVGVHHRHAEADEVVDHGDDLAGVAQEDLAHAERQPQGEGEDDDHGVAEHARRDGGQVGRPARRRTGRRRGSRTPATGGRSRPAARRTGTSRAASRSSAAARRCARSSGCRPTTVSVNRRDDHQRREDVDGEVLDVHRRGPISSAKMNDVHQELRERVDVGPQHPEERPGVARGHLALDQQLEQVAVLEDAADAARGRGRDQRYVGQCGRPARRVVRPLAGRLERVSHRPPRRRRPRRSSTARGSSPTPRAR